MRKEPAYRYECGRIIVATEKIIREIASQTHIHTLLVSKETDIEADEILRVKPSLLERVSGLKSTSDMVAEVDMPAQSDLSTCKRILVLDRLTDPGNVGTLLRSALAFAWDGVFFQAGGVDPFNEKVIRASRGALFRLPYQVGEFAPGEKTVLVADTKGKAVETLTPPDKLALVLGSEAHGPSGSFKAQYETITIPMEGAMESLNVAISGSVLLYALARKSRKCP